MVLMNIRSTIAVSLLAVLTCLTVAVSAQTTVNSTLMCEVCIDAQLGALPLCIGQNFTTPGILPTINLPPAAQACLCSSLDGGFIYACSTIDKCGASAEMLAQNWGPGLQARGLVCPTNTTGPSSSTSSTATSSPGSNSSPTAGTGASGASPLKPSSLYYMALSSLLLSSVSLL